MSLNIAEYACTIPGILHFPIDTIMMYSQYEIYEAVTNETQ